jgi:hypothetical protein
MNIPTRRLLKGALALVMGICLGGCAGRYQITLTNNHLITTRGKPTYSEERNVYEYKTIQGDRAYMPAIRVKTIEPLYRFDKPKSPLNP